METIYFFNIIPKKNLKKLKKIDLTFLKRHFYFKLVTFFDKKHQNTRKCLSIFNKPSMFCI